MKPENRLWAVALAFALIALAFTVLPALAQEITGVPGSPSATTTISGKQLPPPIPNSAG
jgi:arylsulfatase